MTIELKPEHQRTIELAIASGAYQSRDEVLDQAFGILREQLGHQDRPGTGFAQPEQGQLMDWEETIRMLRKRRSERRQT